MACAELAYRGLDSCSEQVGMSSGEAALLLLLADWSAVEVQYYIEPFGLAPVSRKLFDL